MSEAIKMFAPVEDIILDGEMETGYVGDRDSVNLLARKHGDESVLLVSDYSPGVTPVKITVPGQACLEVVDLLTDTVIARLNVTERTFAATLRPDFQARLYQLRPGIRE